MKKTRPILSVLLAAVMLFSMCAATATAQGNDIKVLYRTETRSEYVTFNDWMGYPFIDSNDRTLTPLRTIADTMGLSVAWYGDSRKAVFTMDQSEKVNKVNIRLVMDVSFTIDSSYLGAEYWIYRNGTLYEHDTTGFEMDTAPVIVNDRTYAPARYLAESFGFPVGWDGPTRTVLINGYDDWFGSVILGE